MLKRVILIAGFLFLVPIQAHAYLDPGTGSYITQLLIGFLLGGLYLIKVFWSKIVSGIKSIFKSLNKNAKKVKNT